MLQFENVPPLNWILPLLGITLITIGIIGLAYCAYCLKRRLKKQ